MGTSIERLTILKMVQEGKITPEEGSLLLERLDESRSSRVEAEKTEVAPGSSGKVAKWFNIRVTDTNTGKIRVNVRIPVSMVTTGLKMGAKFSPEIGGLDSNKIMDFIRSGEVGTIFDAYDHEDGEHVEVFME